MLCSIFTTIRASLGFKMTRENGILAVLLAVALIVGVATALPPEKIVGGSTAAPGEFPYQVSLRLGGGHACGGAIVTKRHILTAAHCVVGVQPYNLKIATGSISSTGGQIHSVSKIIYHPSYNTRSYDSPNDIAVITLTADIKFDNNQKKISLPTAPTPGGVTAIATGWGYTSVLLPRVVPTLLKVKLTTLSVAECQQKMSQGGPIYHNQICTYIAPGRGTCQGDSGGPLAYNGQLIGLVSYGIPCAVGYPDVFTSVYHQLGWINENTKI